jgi:flagellar hook protein FlgE
MPVTGNTITNVNTAGYRNQRMDFQDFVYQYVGTANGNGQVGRGTNVAIIMNDFSQGPPETTTSSTDIAITGNGFFAVKPQTNNMTYYTRAGNFTFNKEGKLVDPHGYVLQGLAIDRNLANRAAPSRSNSGIIGTTPPVDITLDTFTCAPRHTTNVVLPVNLRASQTASVDDKSTDATDPFFALLNNWDANQTPPLGTSAYAHQTTIEVYDEAGKLHKLSVYFDRVVDGNGQIIANSSSGESYWEYIITMDPSEDVRDFNSVYDSTGSTPTTPNVPDRLKGLLAAGTITFDSTGSMKDMTCFVPDSVPSNSSAGGQWWDPETSLGAKDEKVRLGNWVAAPISSNGYPMIAPNFSGSPGLQTVYGYDTAGTVINTTQPNVNADGRLIAIDLGLRLTQNKWPFTSGPAGSYPAAGPDALVVARDVGSNKYFTYGMDGMGELQATATTNYGDSFYEHNGLKQDGYTYGDLRSVSVSTNGVLSASYSNGITLQLYQIILYDFPSTQNLRREGGNLFSETRESGSPSTGAPGTGTFGTTQGNSLEQSNADLSREFVNMITTQRGFQANSKNITTVDTMLETVIGMKR